MRKGKGKGKSEIPIRESVGEMEKEEGKGFFACYLLSSLSPRHKGHTYIGFTVNPRRRIRQHNGEIRCGAWRTKRKRPWEMVLSIYGFPSNVSALQFEWAWQHPTESLAVRKAAANFKSLSGVANKIKLAYTMLTLPAWQNLDLTVNFFSTKYVKHTAGCPRLPEQMEVRVRSMDELPCYTEGWILEEKDEEENDKDSDVDGCDKESMDVADIYRAENGQNMEKRGQHLKDDDGFEKASMEFEKASMDIAEIYRVENVQNMEIKDDGGLRQSMESLTETDNNPLSGCLLNSPEFSVKHNKRRTFSSNITFKWLDEGNGDRAPTTPRPEDNFLTSAVDSCFSPEVTFMGQSIQTASRKQDDPPSIDLVTPEVKIKNRRSPSNCLSRSCGKRASVYTEIIDLTNSSPIFIQL
ncbi:excinuclease ABC, C subunit, N-terminal [Tasmannia lanceolata]|uniref:excinuclease ABC, C subunit, N-terminal n=1 Tax=Tasmannia lanceolata TaxID=3420 RepID=UPI004064B147